MEKIIDLHVHSKYARGCSPKMDIKHMAEVAKIKGIDIVGTGDFTHPEYLKEIKKNTQMDENGMLVCDKTHFIPTVEVNNTFESPAGKKRRVHTLVVMPDIESAEQFNTQIENYSKLGVDGRPWVRMSLAHMTEVAYSVNKKTLVIPAHIWTPWFSVFGAKAGFDSLEEAFEEQVNRVYAAETGLSSDPAMNWRCSWLDRVQMVSFSDAHSPPKLGREMTILDIDKIKYDEIFDAFKNKEKRKIVKTIEFFPQEGKYFSDGCRNCSLRTTPKQTKEYEGRCPKCAKKITKGVLGRIDELADRDDGIKPKYAIEYESLVPLQEIISMAIQKGVATKSTLDIYYKMIEIFSNEYRALHAKKEDVKKIQARGVRIEQARAVIDALQNMHEGELNIEPGYDGKFGVVGLRRE